MKNVKIYLLYFFIFLILPVCSFGAWPGECYFERSDCQRGCNAATMSQNGSGTFIDGGVNETTGKFNRQLYSYTHGQPGYKVKSKCYRIIYYWDPVNQQWVQNDYIIIFSSSAWPVCGAPTGPIVTTLPLGGCPANCDAEWDTLASQCGGTQNIISWDSATCKGFCLADNSKNLGTCGE